MAKKNLSERKRKTINELIGYTLPVYHDKGKKCYVDFRAWDPSIGEMRRKKTHVDRCKTKVAKKRMANQLIAIYTEKLQHGWNPWIESDGKMQHGLFTDCMEKYVTTIQSTLRGRSVENYRSRVKIMLEYNAHRRIPIKYAHEYTRAFVIEFLDWLTVTRGVGGRTRNNYRGWCSAFGEYLKDRDYLRTNPVADIPKVKEGQKKRQPLTPQMLRQLFTFLHENDKPFLLACMMEYYTFIRPSELSAVRISDLNIKEQSVFVPASSSKNGKDGFVGLNKHIIRLMLDLDIFSCPSNWMIFSDGFKPSPDGIDSDTYNKRWVKYRKRFGWTDEYQFYSLKDSGIRDLANEKGIVIARDQARHSDIATTNKYLSGPRTVHDETKGFTGYLADNNAG